MGLPVALFPQGLSSAPLCQKGWYSWGGGAVYQEVEARAYGTQPPRAYGTQPSCPVYHSALWQRPAKARYMLPVRVVT